MAGIISRMFGLDDGPLQQGIDSAERGFKGSVTGLFDLNNAARERINTGKAWFGENRPLTAPSGAPATPYMDPAPRNGGIGSEEWAVREGWMPPAQPGMLNTGIEIGTGLLSPSGVGRGVGNAVRQAGEEVARPGVLFGHQGGTVRQQETAARLANDPAYAKRVAEKETEQRAELLARTQAVAPEVVMKNVHQSLITQATSKNGEFDPIKYLEGYNKYKAEKPELAKFLVPDDPDKAELFAKNLDDMKKITESEAYKLADKETRTNMTTRLMVHAGTALATTGTSIPYSIGAEVSRSIGKKGYEWLNKPGEHQFQLLYGNPEAEARAVGAIRGGAAVGVNNVAQDVDEIRDQQMATNEAYYARQNAPQDIPLAESPPQAPSGPQRPPLASFFDPAPATPPAASERPPLASFFEAPPQAAQRPPLESFFAPAPDTVQVAPREAFKSEAAMRKQMAEPGPTLPDDLRTPEAQGILRESQIRSIKDEMDRHPPGSPNRMLMEAELRKVLGG